ncbi:MAG: hypothetical protein K6U14_07180 [Firmicutes bacterium]|nr:hypothetical protein [Alicyclobacillaceae bacterium]MCL6497400.1 hypothetical protein [Bacillota bacterium]
MGVSIANPPRFLQAPDEHARLLHPAGPGLVVLARRDGRWQEQRIPVEALPERVRPLAGCPEVFLTQNRFRGPRRIAHLVGLDALWADLNYHRLPQWVGWRPEGIWELAIAHLEAARIPAPTLAIATGRGLCLLWVHSSVPRQALPR